ncbi:hypothetical protein SDC9_203901 [bioreactor metagenome]|uniref:Uncharacterized protein n=1 Tax=bioreactor metagenome TaxID=1076179 RepID=A0A645IXQ4_9ZZZZ
MSSLPTPQWAKAAKKSLCRELCDDLTTFLASSTLFSDTALPKASSSASGFVEALLKKSSLSTTTASAMTESAAITHIIIPPDLMYSSNHYLSRLLMSG